MTKSRTLLGFDFGRARIGVAVGQEVTATAQPLAILTARAQRPDWDAIGKLIAEWQPDLLVVGIPYHADGSHSATTVAALRFSRQLQGRYRLAVATVDERLSSREAEQRNTRQSLPEGRSRRGQPTLDHIAAAVILETWFNQFQQQSETSHASGH